MHNGAKEKEKEKSIQEDEQHAVVCQGVDRKKGKGRETRCPRRRQQKESNLTDTIAFALSHSLSLFSLVSLARPSLPQPDFLNPIS